MEIFAIAVIGTVFFVGCQTLVHKIKGAMIMRRMAKEKQALDKRMQQHLDSKRYVTF